MLIRIEHHSLWNKAGMGNQLDHKLNFRRGDGVRFTEISLPPQSHKSVSSRKFPEILRFGTNFKSQLRCEGFLEHPKTQLITKANNYERNMQRLYQTQIIHYYKKNNNSIYCQIAHSGKQTKPRHAHRFFASILYSVLQFMVQKDFLSWRSYLYF